MDRGAAERIGLDHAFVVALPHGGSKLAVAVPSDDARALANEDNLRRLDTLDPDDRGVCDIWER